MKKIMFMISHTPLWLMKAAMISICIFNKYVLRPGENKIQASNHGTLQEDMPINALLSRVGYHNHEACHQVLRCMLINFHTH